MWASSRFTLQFIVHFLILTLPFAPSSIIAQTSLDSIKSELEKSTGTVKVDLLNQLSKFYEYSKPDSSLFFALQAESLASELKYKSGQALSEMYKGNYYVRTGTYEEALLRFDVAISLFEEAEDKDGLQKTYNNKGNTYRIMGDYDNALFNFLESLRISEEEGIQKGVAYASLNIGLIYAMMPENNEAAGLPYFLNALQICRAIGDQRCVAYAINNIAIVYTDLERFDKALEYYQESIEIKKAQGDQSGLASSLGNISDIYTILEDYQTSLIYSLQSLEIYREINDLIGINHGLLDVAKAYFLMGEFEKAVPYLDEALELCEINNSLQLKSGTYLYHHQYYKIKGNYKKALEFYEKHIAIEDSIYSETSAKQIAEMRALYETEKKEAEIAQLTNEKTIQELKLRKSENTKWHFIIVSILVFLLAIFIYSAYRQKRKANILLEERNKFEIENKKKAISLFGQQVSKEVALELLSDSFQSGSKKLFACIMFLDIRDFSPYAEDLEPSEIISSSPLRI